MAKSGGKIPLPDTLGMDQSTCVLALPDQDVQKIIFVKLASFKLSLKSLISQFSFGRILP